MSTNGSVELSLLHVRINELERRLARMEQHLTGSSPDADATETATTAAPAHAVNGNGTTAVPPAPEPESAEQGHEGARLVAIELLSAGYERHEVETYLHSTFGISDTEAVLNGGG